MKGKSMSKGIIDHLVKSNKANIKSISNPSTTTDITMDTTTREYIEQLERENRKLKEIIKMLLDE